ncbi:MULTISPECIES: type II toxin-antitoxin system RelE/ParE family toxin [Oligella]|nr:MULTISPECIES: type II toxin-antitoxin system RelE/ParE family toxin [Oligella]OFS82472.1 hypothetical protein HMPREF3144_10975 [Oligella sp. HMSC05A10]OFV51399.1 hypothetical protein HMPREF3179_00800 [Oligella sp. HMSC09E12]
MKYQIKRTDVFDKWLSTLKDKQAVKAINIRIIRFINGNFGDSKQLSERLYEMRIFIGKGYRVYYTIHQQQVIILLCGGHKGTQRKDIENAKQILKSLEN